MDDVTMIRVVIMLIVMWMKMINNDNEDFND